MGEVYRAQDTKLDREVALKILPPDLVQNQDRVRRFVQEAKSASALSHPYIVTIHEIGEENGVHFIAMELVDGGTLKNKIHQEQASFKQILGWLAQVAEGLAKAHAAGIIHRDLKPDNIMITRDGFAKVLDFGLAKLTEPLGTDGSQLQTGIDDETAAGAVLGTVGYMSPEQVQGKSIDPRSDVFAFGCILYEAATRQRPFAGETAVDTMHQILRSEPQPVRELSPETPSVVRRLIRRTLAKDPEQRFQSMRDLAFELSDLAEEYDQLSNRSDSQTVSSSGVLEPITSPKRVNWLGIVGVLAAVVAFGLLALNLMRETPSDPNSATPVQASFKQLTYQSGHESHPDISPDGNFVVYAGTAGTSTDLFLLRVGGSKSINLTETPQINEWSPAYSPDGQSIAFSSNREGGGIFVMGSTGESIKRLAEFGSDPAWSPDGSKLVFASENFTDPANRASYSNLYVQSVSGGDPIQVTKDDAMQPSWSPDGSRIAFWGLRGEGGIRDLATIPAAGGEVAWATDDSHLDWNPVWSANGRWLYFASDRGGSINLWRVAINQQTGQVEGTPEAITTPSSSVSFFSLARDEGAAVYTDFKSSSLIRTSDFDPDSLVMGDQIHTVLESGLNIVWAQLSPDGQRLALDVYGAADEIYVANSDGSGLQRVTTDSFKDRGPRWTPDGRALVFYSDRAGNYESWRINPDGSGLQQLTALGGSYLWPDMSADGRYLMVADLEGGTVILDLGEPLPATKPVRTPVLEDPDLGFSGWQWSPDGSRIVGQVYTSEPYTQESIAVYSMEEDKTEIVYSAPSGQFVTYPHWLLDGGRIVFASSLEDGGSALIMLDTADGETQVVWEYGDVYDTIFQPAPGNRSMLILESEKSSDLWLATFN